MGLYRLELLVPGLPPSNNKNLRKHHLRRNDQNKLWYREIYLASRSSRPPEPLIKCRLTLIRFTSSFLDYDNLVSSFKAVVDGLTHAKVIIDDKWTVTGKWNVDQVKIPRSQKGRIEIVVEELSIETNKESK